MRQGPVELQHVRIDQLQGHVGEYRFAQRGAFEHAVRVHRGAAVHIGHAERAVPGQLALLDHRDAYAGHAERAHPFGQIGEEGIGGNPRMVVTGRVRRAQRRRSQRRHRRAGRSGHQETTPAHPAGSTFAHLHRSPWSRDRLDISPHRRASGFSAWRASRPAAARPARAVAPPRCGWPDRVPAKGGSCGSPPRDRR